MSKFIEHAAPFVEAMEGTPNIFLEDGQLPRVLDEILAALAASSEQLELFVWSGGIYRIHHLTESQKGSISRPRGAIVLHHIDAAHLSELITRSANLLKYDCRQKAWRPIDCPRRIAEAILSRGHWPELRHLNGIVSAPTVSADWQLIEKSGFHPQGLYLYNTPDDYLPVSNLPTITDAKAAIEKLSEAISTFPWVDECDRAAAIAAILTALVRRSLPSAPMIGITAPTPGTGKSLLADVVSMIALGHPSPVFALGQDENETEKRLYAAILAGDLLLLLDNIEQPLRGAVLCQVLTQPSVRFRPLGGSSVVIAPTCTTMIATGNNLDVRGDLRRRVMLIRLDAKMERPEQRAIQRDALAYVLSRRGALIRAALTVIHAYHMALPAPPQGLPTYGGFQAWDMMVRRPLVWAGLPDPLRGAESLRETDPDLEVTRAMFAAWHGVYGQEAATVADAISKAKETVSPFDADYDYLHSDLKDAVHAVSGERLEARRLGGWLRRHKDRIVDGLQLVQAGKDYTAKVSRWQVIPVGKVG